MLRIAFAGLGLLLVVGGLVGLSRGEQPPSVGLYLGLMGLGLAPAWLVQGGTRTISARLVFAIAAAAQALTLVGQPLFEDDYWRFLWDGYRTAVDGTPYGVAPEQFFGDPSVDPRQQRVLDGVNHPEAPTIYGPVLQGLFLVLYHLAPAEPWALRVAFGLGNLALIAILLQVAPARRVALYAWSPLALTETSLNAHPDGLMAFALAGLLLARGRSRLAIEAVLLAIAAGVKIVALAMGPILLRKGWRAAIAPCALAVAAFGALYAPFALHGPSLGFDGAATFAAGWTFNAGLYSPLAALLGDPFARRGAGVLGIAAILAVLYLRRKQAQPPMALVFGLVLLVSPVVNAWYVLWLLPFATFERALWPWALAAALPLSYATGLNLGDQTIAAFAVHPLARGLEIAIIGAAVLWDAREALNRFRIRPRQGFGLNGER